MSSISKLRETVRGHCRKLVQLHDTPHAIAGGIAVGILLGFTPLISLKTLLAIGLAWLLGYSRVAAAVAVTLHDITLPLSPVLARLEYGIGYWILSRPHHWPPKMHAHHLHLDAWFRWDVLQEILWPMLIGALVIGIPLAVASFFVTRPIIARYQKRRDADAALPLQG